MAKRQRLLELAISGLKHELAELEADLRGVGKDIMKGFALAGAGEMGMPLPRKRKRRMSAAARKKISEAAKARWARRKVRAAPQKSAKRTRKASAAARAGSRRRAG